MEKLTSRFRLTSTAFRREDEENRIDPKHLVVLAVEGDETEKTYFQHLSSHLDRSLIRVEILRHKHGDGYSDPRHVIELLNEYVSVRDGQLIPVDLLDSLAVKYSKEVIRAYLNNKEDVDPETRTDISDDLVRIGIDLEYRKWLHTLDGETDYFAVVLDRDSGNHSVTLMEECFKWCESNGYGYFITNPCFEFWLLLHLCDVKSEYTGDQLEVFKENPKISNRHTAVSREVSIRAHHGKSIGPKKFEQYYFPHIQDALIHVQQFQTSYPDLLDDLGSNLWQLFGVLGFDNISQP